MSVSLQLGLVQEMKTAGLLSDPIISQVPRVLLTVGGRRADQKNNLFSNFLNGELKNKPSSQPLMLCLFTGSTSFLSLAATSEEMGDCFLLSLFLPSFPSQKWALCVYRSPTLYFSCTTGKSLRLRKLLIRLTLHSPRFGKILAKDHTGLARVPPCGMIQLEILLRIT